MADRNRPLEGTLVLLIEEHSFFAMYVGDALTSAGAQVLGPARTAAEAEALVLRLRVEPFAVVVSTNVYDADSGALGEALARLGSPLLLLQKSDRRLRPSYVGHDVLRAPFGAYQIVGHLRGLRERGKPSVRTAAMLP
jgi:hypothetical protein